MSLSRFGVRRPVPVNILMIVMIIGGIGCGLTMTREFFPESNPESAQVTLPYPGATPEEIEETLAKKVEDKLADLDEVERLTTTIAEGGGGIMVEFRDGIGDVDEATREVERAVDSLLDLPDDAEEIQVTAFEPVLPVIMVTLFGDSDEESMKRAIRAIKDDLKTLPDMADIVESGTRDYEIRVDLDLDRLLQHGLSLPDVSDAISRWMADIPGGTVRTDVGNVNVRLVGVEERAQSIREIVVSGDPAGLAIRVGDLGVVREDYVDEPIRTRHRLHEEIDGEVVTEGGPSVSLTAYKTGDQDAVEIARMVRAYVAGRNEASGVPSKGYAPTVGDRILSGLDSLQRTMAEKGDRPAPKPLRSSTQLAYELGLNASTPLPAGTRLTTSSDLARFIEGRLDLLLRNAKFGAILVFATLLIFLNWRTAFWVGVGLFTALCGTLIFMQVTGTTLNLLTMFGLIVVLGLLVDDAIVVAENIQARHDRGEPSSAAAVTGANQVAWPVVATVLTSIFAFLPLTFVKGQIGDLLGALPYVVACALAMSLLESLLILPSHMAHSLVHRDQRTPGAVGRRLQQLEKSRDRLIMDRLVPAYGAVLAWSLRYRYVSLAGATCAFLVSVGMVVGGRLQFEFIPVSDAETIIIEVDLPIGSSLDETEAIVQRIEDAAAHQPETTSVSTLLGVQASVDDTSGVTNAGLGTHLGQLFIELLPTEERDRESSRVIQSIRDDVGTIAGVERVEYSEIQGGPAGKDITMIVSGADHDETRAAADDFMALLGQMDGVFDITDDDAVGQREVQVALKPGAAALGLSASAVARQVRGALYGLDAHVYSAHQEDIDVRVRLAEASRRSLHEIENLWIIAPGGTPVPLVEIAELTEGNSYNTIKRVDRRRAIHVTADTAPDKSPEVILPALAGDIEQLKARYPTVRFENGGRQRQMGKAFESLPVGFMVSAAAIFVILAWLFGSYTQPVAVMLAIPFGIIGVIWGHVFLGEIMTFMSLIGFVALSGIVVNDSLILVQFYNEIRDGDDSISIHDALIAAGRQRLRPIMLTTITTVLGLTPLMLEQSFQAKFLIPMAISISFGLLSATVLILLVLPCIIVMFDDIRRASRWLWHGGEPPERVKVVVESD